MAIDECVRDEIESLHRFFVDWFGGRIPESAFEASFLSRFADDLVFVPPAGRLLGLDALRDSVRAGYASNPRFRVAIRNVEIRRVVGDRAIATYEAWQRHALASTPPDNGRRATVIFRVGDSLLWEHIHETWMPAEEMAAGPYDF